MRVAHICSSVFTEGLTYQENLLAQQHQRDGHEVAIFAPTERIDSQTRLIQCAPGWSKTATGIPVLRLPHPRGLPLRLAQKFRWMTGLRQALEAFQPDAALFHGPQSLSLLTFRNFQRQHPGVHCHVDCHSDPYTSGTSWLSRNLLHRLFYRPIVRIGMRGLEPLLCISVDVQLFVSRYYGFRPEALAFYPLGGFVHDDQAYRALRERGRARLGLSPDQLILLQTGKMDRKKRLPDTLRAFRDAAIPNATLVVAGSIAEDNRAESERLIAESPNVLYLGWANSETLSELLCACDLYVQPGAQSATMQMAICSRCPVLLRDVPSHAPFLKGNGWLVRNESDILEAFSQIRSNPDQLGLMATRSLEIARDLLDYRSLAQRILMPRPQ
jgi:1,2-diacylglycerol 3-alpha-glucosyltransferase